MNGKILIAALFLLSGCSIASNLQTVTFDTHGKSQEQFARDKAACSYETQKLFAGDADITASLVNYKPMLTQCLESKGYTPQ